MVGCVWVNGTVQTAKTWEDLEQAVRESHDRPLDPEAYRFEMQDRAKSWSGVEINVDGSAEDFFWELERGCLLDRLKGDALSTAQRTPRNIPVNIYKLRGAESVPYYPEK